MFAHSISHVFGVLFFFISARIYVDIFEHKDVTLVAPPQQAATPAVILFWDRCCISDCQNFHQRGLV